MAKATCPNPKCGAALMGAEKYCRLCGHPVSSKWVDEMIDIGDAKGTGTAFGGAVVVGGTADSDSNGDYCNVYARVKGMAQMSKERMRPGDSISLDGGDLGFFEVTLTTCDEDDEHISFLVTKLRDAPR